ncbi:bacillithiol biosynthesis cysteine-adding enzyme BshC [Tenacibaculum tangerinum]|uniref:Putative cysteine ligase BshC n=1 Tax=Tenacibaculum tangerinum TaxID=3038772 RepID=A0ABY8L4J4_9FLAO|nr:bacillithiol biosynthesis cysteine-adding enzyme BshC [Tenacibaculum tangerinum]WGH75527.1 bacillithiol biosynthesis cysteine-adding enzyme BshC [Tenacibaculum tangerinum]
MKVTHISYKDTGFFSETMKDYLDSDEKIQPFYNRYPSLQNFGKQLEEKKANNISTTQRQQLVAVLRNQYNNTQTSFETQQNIKNLLKENTFTITTGHQLNLFTGPLYFLYKIISTINMCEHLAMQYPNENFVPIYWMATEDHDFEEINYFNFKGKKVQWNSNQTGPVGRFSTEGLEDVFEVFSEHLGTSRNAIEIKEIFKKGYLEHETLANATRYIANELFGKYGLVILDADERELKRALIPYIEYDLLHETSYKEVSKTITALEKNYKIQVNPREINLFYITDSIRERIVFENGIYKVNDTDISWTKEEILDHLHSKPECFSPNVIMRPLYQEVILPNLCYIGGGGELAYWLELKGYFDKVAVPFPILLLRNSAQILSEKQQKKLEKLNVSKEELFLKQDDLLAKKVVENGETKVDFTQQKQFLQQQFDDLRALAKKTDVSFVGAVNAQERKQLKGLENLEKRWLRAEKRRQKDLVERIVALQNELVPNQSLEERQRNFSEFYLEYGADFIKVLKENLHPLQLEFALITL